MITQQVRIPLDRIGVLIGHNGTVKEYVEKKSQARIKVDSKEGDVYIEGEDQVKALRVTEVVKAIGRGFSPEKTFKLLDDDLILLDVLNLSSLSSKMLKRVKGRIIGKNGKTREIIENLANVNVSVFGKTVSIIGYADQMKIAREAIEKLIDGAPHSAVYSFLERKRREVKDVF
jgi:ribosomal RNA assembly protein